MEEGLYPREIEPTVLRYLDEFPVVAIVGPRQAGKSTLARLISRSQADMTVLDLELPSDLRRLTDPEAYLRLKSQDLVCIDEIQRKPDLFPVMRALIDEDRRPGRFLILGSASPVLLRQSTESLAGRIAYIHLSPFGITELPSQLGLYTHWLRGGFPRSLLARNDEASYRWREQFVRTYIDRDIPSLGIEIQRAALERLWMLLASATGSLLNREKLTDPIGVSSRTIGRYIDILEETFMVRVLRPRVFNTKKRLVKTPKVYIRDTGILHTLLQIETLDQLYGSISIGPSWESYALEQIVSALPRWRPSFYRTTSGAEVDLVLDKGATCVAIEFKSSTAPKAGKGFYIASDDISATARFLVAPQENSEAYPVGDKTTVCTPDQAIERIRNMNPA